MKRRLFTFGCSLTAYSWPSWATLLSLSQEFDEVYNWGMAGIGNRGIAERVIECDVKNNFTENDTVIIQWSTHLRHDFFHQEGLLKEKAPGWKTSGSIFSYENRELYDLAWLQTFFDEEAYLYHTLNNIYSTQILLEKSKAKWFMTSIGDIRNLCEDFSVTDVYGEKSIFCKLTELFGNKEYPLYLKTPSLKIYNNKIWKDHENKWLDPILSFLQKNVDQDQLFYKFYNEEYQKTFYDYHPKTKYHYFWLKKVLEPKTGIVINDAACEDAITVTDTLYEKVKLLLTPFQILLFKQHYENINWPEHLTGFKNFKDLTQ
jgi:hypothetical protein